MKRSFDHITQWLLIVFSVPMLIVALLIKLTSNDPTLCCTPTHTKVGNIKKFILIRGWRMFL